MISNRFFLWTAFAALLAASACTGTLVLPGSGGSGGTTSSPGVAGYETAGNTGYSTSYPGYSTTFPGSTTWDTSTVDCQAWVDYPGTASLTVHFVNQTAQTLYLPALCDGRVSFALTTPNGPSDYTYVYDTSCLQTCQALQTQPPYACGVCAPTALSLAPGQARDFAWDGTALEGVLMDPACFLGPSGGTCSQKRTSPQGIYTASASAFTSCSGTCSCDPQGVCTGTPSGQTFLGAATFPFTGTSSVEVVFSYDIPDGG
jgi:hypothetical protein